MTHSRVLIGLTVLALGAKVALGDFLFFGSESDCPDGTPVFVLASGSCAPGTSGSNSFFQYYVEYNNDTVCFGASDVSCAEAEREDGPSYFCGSNELFTTCSTPSPNSTANGIPFESLVLVPGPYNPPEPEPSAGSAALPSAAALVAAGTAAFLASRQH
eukprot:TRINITY_DN14544_c0_g2_i1.p1 TRINITY_DN14544_c0_g2~~TRINITY_DN14544_c0_g2_i1.p1  ORF type:complete len:179 (+),score=18.66 TRINITY_DN14544_c0_g2_i1:63-539(+)